MSERSIQAPTFEEELRHWMPAFYEINDYFVNYPYAKIIPKESTQFRLLEREFDKISGSLTLKTVVYNKDVVPEVESVSLLKDFFGDSVGAYGACSLTPKLVLVQAVSSNEKTQVFLDLAAEASHALTGRTDKFVWLTYLLARRFQMAAELKIKGRTLGFIEKVDFHWTFFGVRF